MSDQKQNPSEIAREALKQLAMRHLAPTPANFQACYNEIAHLPTVAPFPESPLRHLAAQLGAKSGAQAKHLEQLDQAIGKRSWQAVQDALLAFIAAEGALTPRESIQVRLPDIPEEFARRLGRFIESVMPVLGNDDERVNAGARELLQTLRLPGVGVAELQEKLNRWVHVVGFAAEEQVEIKHSLLNLLSLIIKNIGDLSLDDSWLKGQVEGLLAVVTEPISLRRLDDMERRLRDVMAKQSAAKQRVMEAQEEMRQMLAAFIERLAGMHETSHVFQGKIEDSARQIEGVKRIEDLAPLLKEVISATRSMADETANSREQLKYLQCKVIATEAEIVQLHRELDNASALARHDPLTDALNRKGLEEALVREIASMQRKDSLLSLCLLDLDNFKKLNDQFGHEAGDNALIHLAQVARQSLRPTDTLARYGGEEFVILMPDTTAEQGVETIVRLQRELTKAIFMSGKNKVLITFSAGVAQLGPEEGGADAIRRADQAMYLAKRAGKNRVLTG